jgi:hypothetical protein
MCNSRGTNKETRHNTKLSKGLASAVGKLQFLNGQMASIFSRRVLFRTVVISVVVIVHVNGVRPCLWTATTNGPTVHPPDDIWVSRDGGILLTGKNRRNRGKLCPSGTLSTTNPTWADLGLNQGIWNYVQLVNANGLLLPQPGLQYHSVVWRAFESGYKRFCCDRTNDFSYFVSASIAFTLPTAQERWRRQERPRNYFHWRSVKTCCFLENLERHCFSFRLEVCFHKSQDDET